MLTVFTPRLDFLPALQRGFWPELKWVPSQFVLYGGTALSLRLGHRQSVDFDFFATEGFNIEELVGEVAWLQGAERLQSKPNTLTVIVNRNGPIRLSFFGGLSLGRVGEPELTGDNVLQVAASLDLAGTKAVVVQQRAEWKDYFDLAFLLKTGIGLDQALGAAQALYGELFNPMITLKALSYFKDGDLPSLPPDIRAFLSEAASRVTHIPHMPRASERISAR